MSQNMKTILLKVNLLLRLKHKSISEWEFVGMELDSESQIETNAMRQTFTHNRKSGYIMYHSGCIATRYADATPM